MSTSSSSAAVIGCLLDVSGSMREALEPGRSDERATERLAAVLGAAVKIAQAEQRHDSNALIFVGVFGLATDDGCPPVVDLCSAVDALLGDSKANSDDRHGGRSRHDLLVDQANENNVSHIMKYIREKLTDEEARIVESHLGRHPEQTTEFMNAIPSKEIIDNARMMERSMAAAEGAAVAAGDTVLFTGEMAAVPWGDMTLEDKLVANKIYHEVNNSEALRIARRICAEWLQDFSKCVPLPVGRVIRLLKRLQERPEPTKRPDDGKVSPSKGLKKDVDFSSGSPLLGTVRRYMYGLAPMRQALSQALKIFQRHPKSKHRILALVSGGLSTDGDPLPLANDIQKLGVSIATVHLSSSKNQAPRQLYYQPGQNWDSGQQALFDMSSRVSGVRHPIPVLLSLGWQIPSAGEVALHAAVASPKALGEFFSLLFSASFGSAASLLDIVGRLSHDSFINDEYVRRCRDPSDQGKSATCYAHATAAVIHMALLRIVGREGGYPTIQDIREWIDAKFPPQPGGHSTKEVLTAAARHYRPLKIREVEEDGARQAVLRRRPVLTTFRLSEEGWDEFDKHFYRDEKRPVEELIPVLKVSQMEAHRGTPSGGHAVVLISCAPDSLTFLNSWGDRWGNRGSFSAEDHTALEPGPYYPIKFYDVYWLESDLTPTERQKYTVKVDEELHCRVEQYPSVLDLEAQCPLCGSNMPLARFEGHIREVECPRCSRSFVPEPEHLMNALHAYREHRDGTQVGAEITKRREAQLLPAPGPRRENTRPLLVVKSKRRRIAKCSFL